MVVRNGRKQCYVEFGKAHAKRKVCTCACPQVPLRLCRYNKWFNCAVYVGLLRLVTYADGWLRCPDAQLQSSDGFRSTAWVVSTSCIDSRMSASPCLLELSDPGLAQIPVGTAVSTLVRAPLFRVTGLCFTNQVPIHPNRILASLEKAIFVSLCTLHSAT